MSLHLPVGILLKKKQKKKQVDEVSIKTKFLSKYFLIPVIKKAV